jgi:hypothetical protein
LVSGLLQQYPLLTLTRKLARKPKKAIEKLDEIAVPDEQRIQSSRFCVSLSESLGFAIDVAVRHSPEIIRHDERKLDKISKKLDRY